MQRRRKNEGERRIGEKKERKKKKEKRKKLELGWVARRCWHSTGHGQINPDHVTLGVGVLAGPRNNRIARSVYQRALLRIDRSRFVINGFIGPLIYLAAPNSLPLLTRQPKFSIFFKRCYPTFVGGPDVSTENRRQFEGSDLCSSVLSKGSRVELGNSMKSSMRLLYYNHELRQPREPPFLDSPLESLKTAHISTAKFLFKVEIYVATCDLI